MSNLLPGHKAIFLTGTDECSMTFIVESIGVYETQKKCERYLLMPQTSLSLSCKILHLGPIFPVVTQRQCESRLIIF